MYPPTPRLKPLNVHKWGNPAPSNGSFAKTARQPKETVSYVFLSTLQVLKLLAKATGHFAKLVQAE